MASHLDYVQSRNEAGLLIHSKKSNATFDIDLADELNIDFLDDNVVSIFVDKKGSSVGNKRISKKERKHIKQQVAEFDDLVDFDFQFVSSKKEAEVALAKFDSVRCNRRCSWVYNKTQILWIGDPLSSGKTPSLKETKSSPDLILFQRSLMRLVT